MSNTPKNPRPPPSPPIANPKNQETEGPPEPDAEATATIPTQIARTEQQESVGEAITAGATSKLADFTSHDLRRESDIVAAALAAAKMLEDNARRTAEELARHPNTEAARKAKAVETMAIAAAKMLEERAQAAADALAEQPKRDAAQRATDIENVAAAAAKMLQDKAHAAAEKLARQQTSRPSDSPVANIESMIKVASVDTAAMKAGAGVVADITAAKRKNAINFLWEATQAFLAIALTSATIVSAFLKERDIPSTLTNALFVVLGFYFGRTNHARPTPTQPAGDVGGPTGSQSPTSGGNANGERT